MNFDTILSHCGTLGYYQLLLLSAFGIVNLLTSMHYFAQTIITFTPEHFCYQKELKNLSLNDLRNFYEEAKVNNFSCEHFTFEYSEGLLKILNENRTKCTKWIYNYEKGYQSVSTELNWVCDRAYKSAIGQSFFFVGSVIGTIFIGFVSDKYGRVPAFLISSITSGFGDFLTSFTNSLWSFAITRFIAGLSMDTMFYTMYIIVFEYLEPKKRTFGLNFTIMIFYTLGLVASPWIAIAVGSWRQYLLASSFPILIVISFPLFLCESAQWLITKNRLKDAIRCLRYIARINGKMVPEQFFMEFEHFYEEKLNKEISPSMDDNFFGLFRTPYLRILTTILLLKSMFITLSYDIMGRNMEGFGISPFYLFSLTSIVYIPAGLTILLLQNKIGRRGTAGFSLILGSFITGSTAVVIALIDYQTNVMLFAILIALGRYGTITAFDADSQHITELLPTSVRGQTLASIHVIGYGFSCFSSYIIYTGLHYYKPLPMLVVSVLMLLGGLLCLPLPETLNRKSADTLAECEEFNKENKWFAFLCCHKKENKCEFRKSKSIHQTADL